jgi:putative hydrolase of the HAD superfamily
MTRALLLDLDNTLVDRDRAFAAWLAVLAEERGGEPFPTERLVALDGGGYGDRRRFFAGLGAALGVSAAAARTRLRRELPGHVRLRAGAVDLLARFPGPAIVVTNGEPSVQRAKVRAAGLAGLVDHVLVAREHGGDKPRAGVFSSALARLGVRAHEAAMVGDHPVADIGGALALGLDAWWLSTHWFAADPAWPAQVRIVSRLAEVLP